jgi:hypothetical protein
MSDDKPSAAPRPIVEEEMAKDSLFYLQLFIAGFFTLACACAVLWVFSKSLGIISRSLAVPAAGIGMASYWVLNPLFDSMRVESVSANIRAAEQDVASFPNESLLHYRLAELYAFRLSLGCGSPDELAQFREQSLLRLAQAFRLGLEYPCNPRRNRNLDSLRGDVRFAEVLDIFDTTPRPGFSIRHRRI